LRQATREQSAFQRRARRFRQLRAAARWAAASVVRLIFCSSAPAQRGAACGDAMPGISMVDALQIPVHRGQSFRRIADSVPVIADSF